MTLTATYASWSSCWSSGISQSIFRKTRGQTGCSLGLRRWATVLCPLRGRGRRMTAKRARQVSSRLCRVLNFQEKWVGVLRQSPGLRHGATIFCPLRGLCWSPGCFGGVIQVPEGSCSFGLATWTGSARDGRGDFASSPRSGRHRVAPWRKPGEEGMADPLARLCGRKTYCQM